MQEYTPFFQGEKRNVTEKLAKYFKYSGLESKIHFDDEKLIYILSVPTDKEKEARKLYQAFYFAERERIDKLENNEDKDSLEEFGEINVLSENLFEDDLADGLADELANGLADRITDDGTDNIIDGNIGASDDVNVASTDDSTDETTDDYTSTATESVSEEVAASIDNPNVITDDENISQDNNNIADDDNVTVSDVDDSTDSEPKLSSLLSGSGSYVMKSEKYNDYIGTFYIFLFLGLAGIVFVILNITEVLTFLNGLFPNLVMGALFLFFVYVGISTGIKAKNLKYEIEEEKQLTDKINQWLSKNVTAEYLKSISNEDISEELDYIKKTETIRDRLINEFGDVNTDYLDRLIEDFYSKNFDNAEDQI